MRIGLVVDATCDLPPEFLAANNIRVLPIGIRVGDRRIVDDRDPDTTLTFYSQDLPKVGPEDGSEPLTPAQTHDWFLEKLVTDFDYVICLTVSSQRSPIFDNATQASFSLLQSYKERRAAAGVAGPFALRVIDSQTVFAGLAVLAAEGVRLLGAENSPNAVRTRLEQLSEQMNTFLVASDLGHIRRRGFQKGDRSSIGDRLRGAFLGLGSMLDMKPVLSLVQGEDKPVSVSPNYEKSAERLLNFARSRVEAGELLAPQMCLSYAGDPSALRDLPGFAALESACQANGVQVHLAMLSPTGGINLGAGAMSLSFAAEPKPFA